jgi:UDP-GlcNAc:undecaprenyl-phosphate GlcNAc-1-phosphate transferase
MVGILDDIFDLDWMLKLSAQILVATMVAISGVQFLSLPIGNLIVGSNLASVSFTVFVIVLFMNAVNFIDGLDGLAAGIICIGSISFFIYSYSLSMSFTSYASLVNVLTVVTIGICIGFLFYNFSEASIFMGDSGSMLLGFLVSCSSIIITGRIDPASQPIRSLPIYMPILLPILIFLFPIFDMSIAVIRRLINKKSPFAADRMHLHHRMLEIGYSKKWSVIILYTWTTFVSLSALLVAFFRLEIVIPISLVMLVVMVLVTWKAHNIWILVKSVVLHKR